MTRFSSKHLVVLSSIAFLIISCAGGTVTPSSTIPTTGFTQPEAVRATPSEPVLPARASTPAVVGGLTPTPALTGLQSATPTDDGSIEIEVGDYFFQPQVVTITVGMTVKWIPVGDLQHTIVSKESPPVFRKETAGSGSRPVRFEFRKPGTYAYFCDYHPGAMDAWVVVIEGN